MNHHKINMSIMKVQIIKNSERFHVHCPYNPNALKLIKKKDITTETMKHGIYL